MKIEGIGASEGISINKVFKFEPIILDVKKNKIKNLSGELEKLDVALKESSEELLAIREKTSKRIDEEHAMIFDAHIQIVNDPEIIRQVKDLIRDNKYNVAYAYQVTTDTFAQMFDAMENDYMRERAVDVRDVARRVISKLLSVNLNNPTMINEEVIVVANDLTPSDTAQLNRDFVKGFITNIGGRTSHSAIMARSLEIPAIVGTKNITELVKTGDTVILDGINGVVLLNPSDKEIKKYHGMHLDYLEKAKVWKKFADKETITLDNHHVELAANIGSPQELETVIKNGAEGVGLYRTEFLYMNNDNLPTEDEQFIAYKMVLESLGDKKVIIRTLDIGGDKKLDYLEMEEELNPFLGHRALRLCLEETSIFRSQLRALLKASKYGNLHIMFPMVATIEELRQAKALLTKYENELKSEGIEIGSYKIGIMVEIPAVAILADHFAKEVDFFSIGTNDLIQYTFAADRMNQKVAYLYQPLNPSLLRLIKMVIDAAHKEGIFVGMCGEMAGDRASAAILLGLGLDEFSMSASNILQIRSLFSKLNKKDMEEISKEALKMSSNNEVNEYINSALKKFSV